MMMTMMVTMMMMMKIIYYNSTYSNYDYDDQIEMMNMTTQVQSGSGDQTNCNTRVVKITKHNEPLGATVSIFLSWYQSSNGDWDNTQIWSSIISLWGAAGSWSQDNLSPQTTSPLWCQKYHFTISFKYFHFSSVFLLVLYCFNHRCKHQHIIMMISDIIQIMTRA